MCILQQFGCAGKRVALARYLDFVVEVEIAQERICSLDWTDRKDDDVAQVACSSYNSQAWAFSAEQS